MTPTPLSRLKCQRSTCRGRGHIVAASRTACCFFVRFTGREDGCLARNADVICATAATVNLLSRIEVRNGIRPVKTLHQRFFSGRPSGTHGLSPKCWYWACQPLSCQHPLRRVGVCADISAPFCSTSNRGRKQQIPAGFTGIQMMHFQGLFRCRICACFATL